MIRLNMRLENRYNGRIGLARDVKVVLEMFDVRIDHRQFCFARAAKHIGGTACLWVQDLPENHDYSFRLSIGDRNFESSRPALSPYLKVKKLACSQTVSMSRMSS